MKQFIAFFVILGLLTWTGCGNLSPTNKGALKNKINNQNGKIDDIRSEVKSMQGSVNTELGNIRNETKINAEKIDTMQQGFVAYKHENSGIQLFQGDGALILILCLSILGVVSLFMILHYREVAKKNEQAVQILAEQVVSQNNADLEDRVFTAALHSTAGKEVLMAIKKYQKFRAT